MKQTIERRGKPMIEGASHPMNVHSGWGFNSYYMMNLALVLFLVAAVIFTLKVKGIANVLVGFILCFTFFVAWVVTLSRLFVRIDEVIRYQHRGYACQILKVIEDGKLYYRLKDTATAEDERAIRNGYRSAEAALKSLTFVANLPGIGASSPEDAQPQASAKAGLTMEDIQRLKKDWEREMIADFERRMNMALQGSPPSKAVPTESQSATKHPPVSTQKRKCRKCGHVAANIGALNKHIRAEH